MDPTGEVVVRRRSDGTVSSVNQVDESGRVHGTRVTYYPDGKTVYSKLTFNHGIKQGPSLRYYDNGQVFEHLGFVKGEKHGPARKYHKSGRLLAEYEFEHGIAMPGLREYNEDGTLVATYPELKFRETDLLASKNRIDLEIYCMEKGIGVKYFVVQRENGKKNRVYLISKNGSANMQFYVRPGETLNRMVEIVAEIPTVYGNILVKEFSYQLTAENAIMGE